MIRKYRKFPLTWKDLVKDRAKKVMTAQVKNLMSRVHREKDGMSEDNGVSRLIARVSRKHSERNKFLKFWLLKIDFDFY